MVSSTQTFFASCTNGLLPAKSWNQEEAISLRLRPRGTGKKLSFVT